MTLVILFIIFGFLQSAVLAISQKRQFLSLVSVINIIFFLGYVFRPLLIIYYFDGYTYKGLNVIEDPYTLTIILAIANYCYLFFVLGVISTRSGFKTDYLSLSNRSAIRLSITLMILGLTSFIYFLYSSGFFNGGILSLFEYIYGERGFYYFRSFSFLFIFGVFGYLSLRKINSFNKAILVLICILISLSFYARQHFIIFVLLALNLIGVYGFTKHKGFKLPLRKMIIAALIALLLVYSMIVMLDFRSQLSGGKNIDISNIQDKEISLIDYVVNSGQLTFLDLSIDAMKYQQNNIDLAGHSLKNILFLPVPSSLFPDKPESFNRALVKGNPGKNAPSPAFGFTSEIYFNFPYIYLFIGPILMYIAGSFFRKSFISIQKSFTFYMLYLFLYTSFFMFIRSGLFSSIGGFIEKIGPFLFIVLVYKLILIKKQDITL